MTAAFLIRERIVYEDGSFVEMVVWSVPEPVPPATHRLKYRLVYIVEGVRVVGYDNERRKGDHRHFKDNEVAYAFVSIEKLLADFVADVEAVRGEP